MFAVGDLVQHKELKTKYMVAEPEFPYQVVSHKTWVKRSENHSGYAVVTENLELIEEGNTEMTKPLYEVKENDKPVFAHKLATNGDGLWVMEEKGTNRVFTCSKSDAEEVMPYTVDISFGERGVQNYSYLSEKGKFEEGDFLLMDSSKVGAPWSLARVMKVDTKSKKATVELKPFKKLLTEDV